MVVVVVVVLETSDLAFVLDIRINQLGPLVVAPQLALGPADRPLVVAADVHAPLVLPLVLPWW